MGLCCCKTKDDDDEPIIQRQSTADLFPFPSSTNGSSRNFRNIQPVRNNARPDRPKIILVKSRVRRTAPLEQRNERIATNIVYPKVVSSEKILKKQVDVKRHNRLFYKRKVNLDVPMLQSMFTALNMNVANLPFPYMMDPLQPHSRDYRFAMRLLNNQKFLKEYRITEIQHVWNPYTLAQFKLRKISMEHFYATKVENKILFHGTKEEHLEDILTNNFNWREVKNGKCGWGISFANNPWYASHYSIRECSSGVYVMILAKVLIGQTAYGDASTIFPSDGDTTTRIQDRQVFVKYDDSSFYPEFVVYFIKND